MLLKYRLEELLKETVADAAERAATAFDRLTDPNQDSIILFGAGQLGKKALMGLLQLGIKPLAFADNNPQRWNQSIEGIPVLSPQVAADKFGKTAAFVITIWHAGSSHRIAQTRQQLIDLGCEKVLSVTYLFWKNPELFLPHYCLDVPSKVLEQSDRVRQAFGLWADEVSANEYLAQIRWRLCLDFDGLPHPVTHAPYFAPDLFTGLPDEVFVDCGAYDGDTIASLMTQHGGSFKHIFALEPDPSNIIKLENYRSSLSIDLQQRISVLPLAASSNNQKLMFSATGNPSSAISEIGTVEVDCIKLDDILKNSPPTFIKMDIEGAEIDALKGAASTIREHLPILAICVYHQQDHLWEIPLLISSISSEYSFFLRPHAEECYECVCYAIPNHRLRSDLN
jgi:FkbM family methyltransferase